MNRDFSLIDANLGRAAEGIRVLEDSARFVLRDKELWQKFKVFRHELTSAGLCFGSVNTVGARVGEDIGQAPVVATEYERTSLYSIMRANCGRVVQSLRVLEEFAKVYARETSYRIESLRYEMYVLEYRLCNKTPQFWLEKYFAEGVVYPLSDSVEEVQWLIEHGAKVIQLREKDKTRAYEKGKLLCDFIHAWNKTQTNPALLIMNDFPDVAAKLPVAGVHVGQDVVDVKKVRRLIGSNKIIGRSNNSLEKLQKSIQDGADYVSIGPVFATPTKPDRAPVGLEAVREAAKIITTPWVAIGGIDTLNVDDVYVAGAKNVAVVRAARNFFG